jgi:hypothetical protein
VGNSQTCLVVCLAFDPKRLATGKVCVIGWRELELLSLTLSSLLRREERELTRGAMVSTFRAENKNTLVCLQLSVPIRHAHGILVPS